MKRKALVVLFCIVGLMVAVGVAQATPFTCTIQQAGVNAGGYYYVFLTDTASTPSWTGSQLFLIPTGTQTITNGMFAAALTAYANSTNVAIDIYVPSVPLAPGGFLYALTAAK
jgi:hypothetical protein